MKCTITGNDGAGTAAALTTTLQYLGVPNAGEFLQAGDVLWIPKEQTAQTNSAMALHGEVVQIVSVHSDTTTPANDYVEVVRDKGGVGAAARATAASAGTLNAYKMARGERQGGDAPTAFHNAMEVFTQYIQIEKETVSLTGSRQAEVMWGPKDQLQWERNKKLKVILRRIERSCLVGQRAIVTNTAQPQYMQGGVLWWLNNGDANTNATAWSATYDLVRAADSIDVDDRSRIWRVADTTTTNWSEMLFFKYVQNALIKGSRNKVQFCGDGFIYNFNNLFGKYIRMENDPKYFGLEVMKFMTPSGTLNMMAHPEMTLMGTTNFAITVDLDYAGYRYKSGNGISRDLRLRKSIQEKKSDSVMDEWTADFAVDLKFRQAHSTIIIV